MSHAIELAIRRKNTYRSNSDRIPGLGPDRDSSETYPPVHSVPPPFNRLSRTERDYANVQESQPQSTERRSVDEISSQILFCLEHSISTASSGEDRTKVMPQHYMYGVPLSPCHAKNRRLTSYHLTMTSRISTCTRGPNDDP